MPQSTASSGLITSDLLKYLSISLVPSSLIIMHTLNDYAFYLT